MTYDPPGGGGGGGAAELLTSVGYAPAGGMFSEVPWNNGGNMSAMNTAEVNYNNLLADFDAPASGKVLVKLEAMLAVTGQCFMFWCLRESGGVVGPRVIVGFNGGPAAADPNLYLPGRASLLVTGLSGHHTLRWAHGAVGNAFGSGTCGSTIADDGATFGPALMEVWAA